MSLPKINQFVLEADAWSRIAIYMINHADSPLIAQLGNFSHDAFRGGFISGDGCMAVSGDASSIQMLPSSQAAISQSACTSMVPLQTSLSVSVSQSMYYPVSTSHASSNVPMIPKFQAITPYDLPDVLIGMNEETKFISLCRMLKLDKEDFDTINEGIFVRTFDDTQMLYPRRWNILLTFDHMGIFDRIFVLLQDAVFELKTFKYTDRPKPYPFLFKPEHPGIWFRDGERGPVPGKTIILDTDVSAVWNRTSPGNAGLIVAGNIAELDYEVFHGRPVQLIWRSETPQCRNQFAGALNFLAEAKKHGVEVFILKCSDSSQTREIIDLPQVRKQALFYGLDIPAPLKEIGHVLIPTAYEEFIPQEIPFFWSKGSSTLFFGSGYKAILKKLLNAFCQAPQDVQNIAVLSDSGKSGTRCGVFPKMQVGIFYSPSTESRTKRLIGQMGLDIPCICSTVLQKEDALETALYRNKIKVLLVVYAEYILPKDLADVLDLCESIQIVTGLFSLVASEEKPSPEDVLKGTVKDLVSQSYLVTANGDSVIAKDMETEIYERYTFEPDGSVSATEVKVTKSEEDEEEQE